MWRDLPEEDKQEYIDEYEVEKVRNILTPDAVYGSFWIT